MRRLEPSPAIPSAIFNHPLLLWLYKLEIGKI